MTSENHFISSVKVKKYLFLVQLTQGKIFCQIKCKITKSTFTNFVKSG